MSVPPSYINEYIVSTLNYVIALNDVATTFANNISSNNTNSTITNPTNTYQNTLSTAMNNYISAVTANNSLSSATTTLITYITTINMANTVYNNAITAIGTIDDPLLAASITAYNAANAAASTAYVATYAATNTAATAYVAAATTAYNAQSAADMVAYNAAIAVDPSSSNLLPVPVHTFDVTQTLEILMDVRIINLKLGIQKDASNILILNNLSDYYDSSTFTFLQNSITITSEDIINAIHNGQLISTGAVSIYYQQFSEYVNSYFKVGKRAESLLTANSGGDLRSPDEFGHGTHGISTLFDRQIYLIPNTELNAYTLSQLFVKGNTPDGNGAYIQDLSGQLYIPNVSQTLRTIVTENIFNNRLLYSSVIEGFKEGDVVCSPNNGITITFSIAMDTKAFAFPEIQTDTIDMIDSQQIASFIQLNPSPGSCTLTNTYNANKISQSYSIGIMIRLANLS